MIRAGLAALVMLAGQAVAAPEAPEAQTADAVPELALVTEAVVDGMPSGNLSGLARCGAELWVVSDRDDGRLYRLEEGESGWSAIEESFLAPPPPAGGLPWGLRVRAWVSAQVRGGAMDFEGLACDALGNRYLVSEAHAAVLRLNPAGTADWLALPASPVRQGRASGMLLGFNAGFEGIAVDPEAGRLWLAAERERRGLVVLHGNQSGWRCTGGCVLLAEGGTEATPPALGAQQQSRSFSGLAFHDGKLFTLERTSHRICRRDASNGVAERCWSYADAASAEGRRYDTPYGTAEALAIDAEGAWIGVDNNGKPRADGERRPVVWRFAAPKGGWSAVQ